MKLTALTITCLCAIGCTGNYRESSTVTEFEQRYQYAKLQSDTLEAEGTRLRIYHDLFPRFGGDDLRVYSLSVRGNDIVSQRYDEQIP